MNYRKATLKDIFEIISLWQEVFGDAEDYVNRFIRHFGVEKCYICEVNGALAAMTFALPAAIRMPSVSYGVPHTPLLYIYACATKPAFQKQGIMAQLLETIYEETCAKSMAGVFLRAANEHLANYYRKLGFVDFFYNNCSFLHRKDAMGTTSSKLIINSLLPLPLNKYLQKREQKLENTCFVDWNENYFKFLKENGIRFCEYENNIFAYTMEDKIVVVEELLGETPELEIAKLFFAQYPYIETVEIRTPGGDHCCGQIKWFQAACPSEGYFAFGME